MMSLEYQIEHFCDDCPHCEDCGGMDYAYGAPMYVHETTCKALSDPKDLACPERAEYAALLAQLDEQNTEDDEDEK